MDPDKLTDEEIDEIQKELDRLHRVIEVKIKVLEVCEILLNIGLLFMLGDIISPTNRITVWYFPIGLSLITLPFIFFSIFNHFYGRKR